MEIPSTASSLYGPGTFICWLCSLVSVLISWSFNHHGKTNDAISNDFLASLALPGIAAVHFLYAYLKAALGSEEQIMQSTVTMQVASSVCLWYISVGSLLLSLGTVKKSEIRLLCTICVHTLCCAVLIIMHLTTTDILSLIQAIRLMFIFLTCLHSISLSSLMRATLYDINWRWISWQRNRRFCSQIIMYAVCWSAVLAFLLHYSTNYSDIYHDVVNAGDQSWFERHILPRSGIAITELDQIVAMVVGVLTILVTIKEAMMSRKLSPWDRYKVWRDKCEALLNEGDLSGDEAAQLKDRLEFLAQREKDVLDAPGSSNVLERMEYMQEKRGLERIAELRHRGLPTYSISLPWPKFF